MKYIFKFAILSTLLFGMTSNAECMWKKKSDVEEEFSKFIFQERVKELCAEVEGDPNPISSVKSQYISKYKELLSRFEKEKKNLKPLDIEVAKVRLNDIKEILKILE